jgi:hypothetical protein
MFAGALAGTNAGDEAAVFLEVSAVSVGLNTTAV